MGSDVHLNAPSTDERLFPTLTAAQVSRIASRGRRRAIAQGDVLVEPGDSVVSFFALVSEKFKSCRHEAVTLR